MYDLKLDRVREEILKLEAKRIMLQLPDGMRPIAFQIAKTIQESTGVIVVLSGDSCYGACDIALSQAIEVEVDLLVHYGHNSMVHNTKVPIKYVHAKIDTDVETLMDATVPYLREWENIGIVTTIQHIHQLKEFVKALEIRGLKPHSGKGGGKTPFDGQILGCSYETAMDVRDDVNGFLYVGGGHFHPKGLMISTGKPVVIANPYNYFVMRLSEEEIMVLAKKRMAEISLARCASFIGIIVSSKPGQTNLTVAENFAKQFQYKGYQAILIYLDDVRPENLNNFTEIEVFVNTACPRIAIDGIAGIDRPILSIKEARVVLDEVKWEDIWGNGYL
jgi:2-(3-amino-3-carboxypropyl)histidine synthase